MYSPLTMMDRWMILRANVQHCWCLLAHRSHHIAKTYHVFSNRPPVELVLCDKCGVSFLRWLT
jgi:hypothetical protein